jgi:hypothetical protein
MPQHGSHKRLRNFGLSLNPAQPRRLEAINKRRSIMLELTTVGILLNSTATARFCYCTVSVPSSGDGHDIAIIQNALVPSAACGRSRPWYFHHHKMSQRHAMQGINAPSHVAIDISMYRICRNRAPGHLDLCLVENAFIALRERPGLFADNLASLLAA